MGEYARTAFISFNSSLRVEFQGSRVTWTWVRSVRELDERLGLSELMDRHSTIPGGARISNCRWLTCYGDRSTAAWRVLKMSTTPRACLRIRPSG